jgi:hypothetical protein
LSGSTTNVIAIKNKSDVVATVVSDLNIIALPIQISDVKKNKHSNINLILCNMLNAPILSVDLILLFPNIS